MFTALRKSVCATLALTLALAPALRAQQPDTGAGAAPAATASAAPAPVPPQILSAHTIFVANGGGSDYFNIFTGGADRAYNTLYGGLQQSGQYQLVDSPTKADLIFQIRSVAPTVDEGRNVSYNPQLILSILDPKTNTVLWTTRASVRAVGRQKTRDREFDACVAVLTDKLGQLMGRQLTPEQVAAIKSNSSWGWSTGAKVLLVVGVAAFAGLTAYGVYRATHPPTLTLPTLPTNPVPVL